SSQSEDPGFVAECAGSRVLVVRVDHQRSDPYAQDRRLARAEASFTAKGSLKGDSKPLVALRSFVIRQLWKKFFRHGYRKIRISTRPGKKPKFLSLSGWLTSNEGGFYDRC